MGTPSAPREPVPPAQTPPHRHRRAPRWMAAALALIVLVLMADGIWAVWRVRTDLRTAKADLSQGAQLLVKQGDTTGAAAAFKAAEASAHAAAAAMGEPAPRLAGLLPLVGANADALRSMADAAELAAQAGAALTDSAIAVGWNGKGITGFNSTSSFDLGPIREASSGLAEASSLMTQAGTKLDAIDTSGLLGVVRRAVEDAKAVVSPRVAEAQQASGAAQLLPGFLGADGERRYLLVTLSLSDPRAGGGFPGQYALLDATGHSIRLEQTAPTSSIPNVKPVAAPPDVVARYGALGATRSFRATTLSPDFPTDARLMLKIWRAAGRPPVDGVIAVDSVWMSYLLKAVGPVHTPTWPEAITTHNVENIVGRDVYLTQNTAESNAVQTAIGTALTHAILKRHWSLRALAIAMSRSAKEGHLKVYSTHPSEEGILRQLGVDGAVHLTPGAPFVAYNGLVASRTGYFAQRTVQTSTVKKADGTSTVTLTITLNNTAPKGPPSVLLGHPGTGYPVGTFATEVSVYLPEGARLVSSTVDGKLGLQITQREFGRSVIDQILEAPAGGSSVAKIVYSMP